MLVVAENGLHPQLDGQLEADLQRRPLQPLADLVVGIGVLGGDVPEQVATDGDGHHQAGRPVAHLQAGGALEGGDPLDGLPGDMAVGRVERGVSPPAESAASRRSWSSCSTTGVRRLRHPGDEPRQLSPFRWAVRTAACRRGRLDVHYRTNLRLSTEVTSSWGRGMTWAETTLPT